jgi:hypothetical protein
MASSSRAVSPWQHCAPGRHAHHAARWRRQFGPGVMGELTGETPKRIPMDSSGKIR